MGGEVHSKIAPEINAAIKKLEYSNLVVAVKLDKKIVKCILLPNEATELRTVIDTDDIICVIIL